MAAPRILFVEDDDSLRFVLADALRRHGFDVVEVISAYIARDVLRLTPAFDLIIADLITPGWDDGALVAEVRRLAAGIPTLLISGYPRRIAERMYDFPAAAPFLPKPFGVRELIATVEELLAGSARP